MARARWEGSLSLGFVSFPVKLYAVAEPKDISFHFLHVRCLTPLQYERYCAHCKTHVSWEETVRGYAYARGRYVPVRPADFARLPLKSTRAIEIFGVVDEHEVDPVRFEQQYYVIPSEAGLEAYHLLTEALGLLGKVALTKVVMRHREHLALLRAAGGTLVLVTLFYEDELRKPADFLELRKPARTSREAREMALELLRSLTTRFEPATHRDEYRARLQELLRARIKGAEIVLTPMPEPERPRKLMEALRASLILARKARRTHRG